MSPEPDLGVSSTRLATRPLTRFTGSFVVRIHRRRWHAAHRLRLRDIFEIRLLIPWTADILTLQNNSLTVSSGGMLPNIGSASLPIASSAFVPAHRGRRMVAAILWAERPE